MAMFIQLGNGLKPIEWHVGEPVPAIAIAADSAVQADGDELVFVESRFQNIPMRVAKSVVRWQGDLARFIVQNL